ncbi:retinal pigment epithelial membrane protein [Pyrenophora tritici-repentis Pt-1C-BFP]|uniref:Retinal pigment epithelial membrane protein n=1 Tax=Pyrenophora tritici-repentis (strain Pt-1C-BFP) TaxID=426418 RepID=B2WAQ2_PYRTR|nr:retinal pigment epithelial membrane protein [Pyrenophora tritici-repentis Pt-1C-BFP]EDU50284.1 retinal pigment epithelial membrane protein [Pyrenophora tritici-repentis Pt-1C-BFP]
MSQTGQPNDKSPRHPYLSGNFASVTSTCPPTPVTWSGHIPDELLGGMYVRNGGNPVTNDDLGREAHWFDGDGMLSGVWFSRAHDAAAKPVVNFVNQFILTDVYLTAIQNPTLRTPILPSISTLVNPASSLLFILWRILRTVLVVLYTHLSGSARAIKRISVANTSILFHDGRALATCESGPPMRIALPSLETVGWFDGHEAEVQLTSRRPHTQIANRRRAIDPCLSLPIRIDVQTLLARADDSAPEAISGCVDNRNIDEVLASKDANDPIKAFRLPPNHFGQEARFVPRKATGQGDVALAEEDGYLLFYVFNEDQLDEEGECKPDARSELWVLDARDMQTVVCKVQLQTRIPYGLHGNWFTEEDISRQRDVQTLRSETHHPSDSRWSHLQKSIISYLG